MDRHGKTRVTLLTPPGRGAVASLIVEGPAATEVVGRLFHRASGGALAEQPFGRILFGRWQSPEVGEELVVCRQEESRIEVHCHGGRAAAQAIIDSLVERGCEEESWPDWVRSTTPDPIRAAARIALADASTERTAAILWDQYNGALTREIDAIEAAIAGAEWQLAMQSIDGLLDLAELGCHLTRPWQVVLAGRPNVGKSSLINALLGYERAIVHPTAGTTRDIVTAPAAIDGWPVEFADTAGLHASNDPLESAGIRLAEARLASADLVVLVFDLSDGHPAEDLRLAQAWPRALHVLNKCDLKQRHDLAGVPQEAVRTSALSREGIAVLERAIANRLVPRVPAIGQAVPFTAEQVAALKQVRDALEARESTRACQLLSARAGWCGRSC